MKNKMLELKGIYKSYKEFKFLNLFKKKYANTVQVLVNISISFYESEIIGISGENGSGKSTLLRVMSGLEKEDQGTIQKEELHKIRYIAANDRSFFWRLTAVQNLELFNLFSSLSYPEVENRMNYYLKIFKLNDSKNTEFMKLSSGQKKKLILIRALLSGADILMFDEVSTNLDKKSKLILFDEILNLRKNYGTSIIWVSHDKSELASICDRTIDMRNLNGRT